MKRAILSFVVILLFVGFSAFAQEKVWTLQECIQYATEHNLDLSQSTLNKRMAKLQYSQTRLSQIPSISLSGNYGRSYGRSIDPTSNQFISTNYGFTGANGNLNVLLFGWFSKRNKIKQDKLGFQAAQSDYQQLKNNISLNVATGYLRVLLAKKKITIAEKQVSFSRQQRQQTKAFVTAGRSSELDLAQINAQVATDSTSYFNALKDYKQSLLQLKALMNLDMEKPLHIAPPPTKNIALKVLLNNTPEHIYEVAENDFYSIKSSRLKIAAARKGLKVSKGQLYPSLSFGLQLGTNFSTTQQDIINPHVTGVEKAGTFVDIGGNQYAVLQPKIEYGLQTTPFFNQIKNNFRQTAVLSLAIPIFNGWAAQTSVKQAKINIQSKVIEEKKAETQLKQDIYQAYTDAKAAAQKYQSTQKASEAAQLALSFAQKRYHLGLVSTLDLLTTKNKAFQSQSDAASAKFDLMFKLKVLDYYLGQPLKLH